MTLEVSVHTHVRILLLEDSEIDADLLMEQLDRGAPAFTLKRVVTEAEFRAALDAGEIDLILSGLFPARLRRPPGAGAGLCPGARRAVHLRLGRAGRRGRNRVPAARGATDYVLKHRLSRLPAAVDRAVTEMRERRERRQAQQQLEESLAALQRSEEALRGLNESLEKRVEARTRELATANRDLLAQVQERQRVEATLGQMQRLEAIGQLTSGLAHDFNNLLTVVLGNLKFVEDGCSDATIERHLAHMRNAAERGASLTGQLLAFSRRQGLEPKSTDLADLVASMRELLQSTMGGGIRVRTSIEPDLWPALVDPNQIELVVLNLAINARDAMPDGGDLTVETANVRVNETGSLADLPAAGDYVALSVTDTGTGMTPEVLARAFEPFFTTKEIGKGSGLGLAQVYGFAKQSDGTVRIDSREGHGTSVRVFLPRATTRGRRRRRADPDTAAQNRYAATGDPIGRRRQRRALDHCRTAERSRLHHSAGRQRPVGTPYSRGRPGDRSDADGSGHARHERHGTVAPRGRAAPGPADAVRHRLRRPRGGGRPRRRPHHPQALPQPGTGGTAAGTAGAAVKLQRL